MRQAPWPTCTTTGRPSSSRRCAPACACSRPARRRRGPGAPPPPPHRHPEEEFMIVAVGTGVIEVDGKKTPVGPGAIMYCGANVLHGITNTGDTTMTFYWSKWIAKGFE